MSSLMLEVEQTPSFADRMLEILNGGALALMISIGHRTRLFDVMRDMEPSTSAEIAAAAGLQERYVREWLGAMTTGRIVTHDPATECYRLPAAHADFLTRLGTANLSATAQFIGMMGRVEERIAECFKHGGGVPYCAYCGFHSIMAEESDQTVVSGLRDHILPLVPGLMERLQTGIKVLDVGCGSGHAMIAMAGMFPHSRFYGWDISEEGVLAGRREARRRGLVNVQFDTCDVEHFPGSASFDLITAFDAIHDQARPDRVLANIAHAVRPGGLFLMQDIAVSSHVGNNMSHPIAPFIYTISCMHCMSVSLARGGMGLGAAWGKELALEMLAEAGFPSVEVHTLAHDIQNYYYIARTA